MRMVDIWHALWMRIGYLAPEMIILTHFVLPIEETWYSKRRKPKQP